MQYVYKKKFIKGKRRFDLGVGSLISRFARKYHYETFDQIHDKDYVVAGYPKSGNTWVQNLLAGIMFGIDAKFLPDSLTQELIPDIDYKVFYKRAIESMCFKTHDLPRKNFQNVIHLIRDPRDVMASYYAMFVGRGRDISQDSLIRQNEGMLFGDWHSHTRIWRENPFNASILLVKYEDIISDTHKELRRILKFMELERSDEIISKVVEGNSIKEMKKKEIQFGFDKQFINKENWIEGHTFVRNGVKGGGKKELDPDILDFLVKKNRDHMVYYNYL